MHFKSIALNFGLFASLVAAQPTMRKRLVAPTAELADGAYHVDLDSDGTTKYTPIPPSALLARTSVAESQLLPRGSGAHCGNHGIDAGSLVEAQNAFSNMCGGGYYFTSRAIVQVRGNALVYGCNYGNGQTCYAGDFQNFMSQIDGTCGYAQAGWFSIEEWNASYGRETNPAGYC